MTLSYIGTPSWGPHFLIHKIIFTCNMILKVFVHQKFYASIITPKNAQYNFWTNWTSLYLMMVITFLDTALVCDCSCFVETQVSVAGKGLSTHYLILYYSVSILFKCNGRQAHQVSPVIVSCKKLWIWSIVSLNV